MENNPYVGPRPYERKDRPNFYGRNREARDLRALIVANRVVLFYAQSGAGKTSLLNAQVIPALEEKGFHVLPVARVGSELPPDIPAQAVDNVFVFSALLDLAGEDADPQKLLDRTLHSFLQEQYPQGEGTADARPLILVLDQFEEVFTTHRDRWQDAEGFFQQARQALDRVPNLGVVFVMREDHVAEIEPYTSFFARRLRARLRMERLGVKGALAAIKRPAENVGYRYDPGVAERLVDDLRRVKVQRHARDETVLGPFVEPVQLQVVCSRLWENLPEQKDSAIRWEEVKQYGNIDRALIDFYQDTLETATRTGVSERRLRRWFGEQLVTSMNTRGLVLRGPRDTAGLPNGAVAVLEARHLIRAEVRAGARWYELTHDRFIEPIQMSNKAWRDKRVRAFVTALAVIVVAVLVISAFSRYPGINRPIGPAEAATVTAVAESIEATEAVLSATAAATPVSGATLPILTDRIRPLKPGLSVSAEHMTGSTIGAFVHDARGRYYLLTDAQVLGSPRCQPDSPVIQPGRSFDGTIDDLIGYVAKCLPYGNRSSIATLVGLVRLKEGVTFETAIPGIGPIRGVRDPVKGMAIRKLGSVTGMTSGQVVEVSVKKLIGFPEGSYTLRDCIETTKIIQPGDGGALVVDEDGYAVGIALAGSQTTSLLAPIQDVLDALDVELAGIVPDTTGGRE